MAQNITGLSPREADFLARLAATGQAVFRYEELKHYWGDASTARHVMSRLHKGGWLRRVERGCYLLVPLSAGPDRLWSENALAVASRLAEPGAVAYWSALHFWNLTEQVPRTLFVQLPRRKFRAQRIVDGVDYRFVHISPSRFYGVTQRMVDGQRIQVTDREKTLVDAIDRPDLSGGAWQTVQVLRGHYGQFDWPLLDDYLARFGSGALYKRLGYMVEQLDLPIPDREQRLRDWQTRLTTGYARLEPGEDAHGVQNRHWRIRDNIDLASRL